VQKWIVPILAITVIALQFFEMFRAFRTEVMRCRVGRGIHVEAARASKPKLFWFSAALNLAVIVFMIVVLLTSI
jgi:hypothetical protein